jgi:heavy metal sensor kinase
MRLEPPGIRARLTLWYAAVLLFILACLSAGVYVFVRASLERTLRTQLDRDIETVATVVAAAPHGKGANGHLRGDVLFAVMENQRLVYHSDAWCRARSLHGAEFEPADSDGVWRSPEGADYRFKVEPLWINWRNLKVTVAEDTAFLKGTMRSLLVVLLLCFPCAALLSVAGGYFLAGRALSPISAMASKAREITAESLSQRLPVGNPDDELGRMATVFNDTLARLEASFDRLRTFVANASHELRTPLTAIRSVGEVALRRPLDASAARDVIGSMLEEVSRLTRMVECLLDLARAEPGGAGPPREAVDLAAMAVSAVELVRVLAEEKGQDVSIDVRAPATVPGDVTTLRQALTNLLDNAIRYTPDRGHIKLNVGHGPGGRPLVEVEDDGPGIAAQDRERIFDRFYRANHGRDGKAEGTGLGLAIARGAVEANGGRLEYESTASGGSRFRMTFPAWHPSGS